MRRRLTLALILLSCLSIGAAQLYGVDWNWDGYNTGEPYLVKEGTYSADIPDTFNMQGHIIISGDVTLTSTNGDQPTINITQDTFISTSWKEGHAHLILYADACSGFFFQVDHDLIFTGSNPTGNPANNRELTLTFSGPGQTVFHLESGKMVGFEGFSGHGNASYGTTPWDAYMDDYTKTGSGVMVYVTMDQTYDEAVVQGVNKVVFERFYNQGAVPDGKSVKISVGHNSFITYISDVADGILSCDGGAGLGYGSIAFDPMCYGPGRMLLHLKGSYYVDVNGNIQGITDGYNDGAVVVAGHYCEDFSTPDGIRLMTNLNKPAGVEAIFRIIDEQAMRSEPGTYHDGSALYTSEFGEPIMNVEGLGDFDGAPSRRGLLVINENKSIPSFAADTYVNNEWANGYIFNTAKRGSTSIRPGFILGTNGKMELFHNTFLDYIAASTQMVNPHLVDQYGFKMTLTVLKKHNPSAFIADGLGILDVTNPNPANPYSADSVLFDNDWVADQPSYGARHAQVLLRGDARLYLRSGAMNDGYVDIGDIDKNGMGGYMYGDDRNYSFTINYDATEGTYDGSFISGLASHGGLWYETTGEGNNVLDVEGKLTIRSTQDDNRTNESGFVTARTNMIPDPEGDVYEQCFARHVPMNVAPMGVLNLPPIKLDYMGQEVYNTQNDLVTRPLRVDWPYPLYNSSSIFLNNELSIHNVHWHHNDVLKIATPEPDKAEPAVVGGEKAAYDYAYWSTLQDSASAEVLYVENPTEQINTKVPLLSMFDSTLHVHESIVMSGMRLVVTDKFWYETDNPSGHAKLVPNTSRFIAYNHGDPLDMLKRGYGRTIMFGTQQNKMADGCLMNDYTQNAYINIYRGWTTDAGEGVWGLDFSGDPNHLIRLSLETEAQPKYTISYRNRENNGEADVPNSFAFILDEGVSQYKRVATQVLYLGNVSYSSVGWTTTYGDQVVAETDLLALTETYSYGINEGLRPRPWDAMWGVADNADRFNSGSYTLADFKFSLSTRENDPAEMFINGDNYYFGGRDTSGNLATEPVVASNEAGIFYTNHGGLTHINQSEDERSPDQGHFYDAFVDTVFAYRQWPRIFDTDTSKYIHGLSGMVDLPHDQVKFGRSIQPYALDIPAMMLPDEQTKESNVHLTVYLKDKYGENPSNKQKASGEEVTIPWNFRTDKSVKIDYSETEEGDPLYTPVKAAPFMSESMQGEIKNVFRATNSPEDRSFVGPVEMPEALLAVATGDVIAQMRVSGATKADPFHLYVTGNEYGYGVVREFTSLASNYFNPGEGCHASIFLDGGAHIGLGQRDWNEHSKNAWSVLGHDYVTLYPNGNCFIWLNSDIIVADRLPIIPTNNFGIVSQDKQSLTWCDKPQRITFFSDVPREIRVLEGGEIDLSAFGNPRSINGDECEEGCGDCDWPYFITEDEETEEITYNWQETTIEFGGKVRVVMEAGSRIRFPGSVREHPCCDNFAAPILYFNDESQLIFEENQHVDEQLFTDEKGSDATRCKILGIGQIWLNKSAELRLFAKSSLGIETDDLTKTTSVTISLNRESKFLIGTENMSGGSFQVGNIEDKGPTHSVDFDLALRSPGSTFSINREGFFGLAVGTINKFDFPDFTWRFLGLHNVYNIGIRVKNGIFEHNHIFDGGASDASAIAIGPAMSYRFRMGDDTDFSKVFLRGGGNVLYVGPSGKVHPDTGGLDGLGMPFHETSFFPVGPSTDPIFTPYGVATPFPTPNAAGGVYANGDHTIMASTPTFRRRTSGSVYAGTVTEMTQKDTFEGDQNAFFQFFGAVPLNAYGINPYVCFSKKQQKGYIGYISGVNNIVVRDEITDINTAWRPEESLEVGALATTAVINVAGVGNRADLPLNDVISGAKTAALKRS